MDRDRGAFVDHVDARHPTLWLTKSPSIAIHGLSVRPGGNILCSTALRCLGACSLDLASPSWLSLCMLSRTTSSRRRNRWRRRSTIENGRAKSIPCSQRTICISVHRLLPAFRVSQRFSRHKWHRYLYDGNTRGDRILAALHRFVHYRPC